MDHEDKPFKMSDLGPPVGGDLGRDAVTDEILRRVDSANLRRTVARSEIRLWNEWPQMLDTLPMLGEVLAVTGNRGAILGHACEYPALAFSPDWHHARSHDDTFDLEFIPWTTALAVCSAHRDLAAHWIEFRDATDTVIHKICLTQRSRRDQLPVWVEQHEAMVGFPVEPAAAFPPARWRTVQQRHWFDYEETEPLPPRALPHVLGVAVGRQMPVRVIVGNEGVVQSADFSPRCLHACGEWMFASDDAVGLHFHPELLADAILHRVPPHAGSPAQLTLKAFDDDGALCLALAPPLGLATDEWNAFLTDAIPHS